MSKLAPREVLTEGLQEHVAFQAWRHVQSDDGEPGSIEVLKRKIYGTVYRLNGIRPDGASIIAKRCPLATGRVERLIYQEVLPHLRMPVLQCYGFLREPEGRFCWLFLEDAGGAPYSAQVLAHRALAASWLGETHLASVPAEITLQLPDRGLDRYLQSLRGCGAALREHLDRTALSADDTALLCEVLRSCDALESHWGRIEKICDLMPRTLVHGDFATKNLRIQDASGGPALLVFDWQFSGWGVPATDLAQCIGHVASPDLEVYRSVLNRVHPQLDVRDVLCIAGVGSLLRVVDEIDWAFSGLPYGDPTSVGKQVATLRVYEARLAEALCAFRRSWSG